MAWKVTDVVNERMEFVQRAKRVSGHYGGFISLCREFGITPKTGYKWVKRVGDGGLSDRSRRPKAHPWETPGEVVADIVRLRLETNWGPEKIKILYEKKHMRPAPDARTIARILDRSGLVVHRKRKRKDWPTAPSGTPVVTSPNDLITVDFKGWWYTQDKRRFEPFTVRDDVSRYVLAAKHLPNARTESVKELMQDLFLDFGLPKAIRSDNGAPFASRRAIMGLTRLSVWWLRYGIQLHRTEPGHPEQNGSHERMHLDMSKEIEIRPATDRLVQQSLLDEWVWKFNHIRPHQSLNNRTPADVYKKSERKYSSEPPEITYPDHMEVRKVHSTGYVHFKSRHVPVSKALAKQDIGIERLDDRLRIWFGTILLGETDSYWTERLR